MHQAFSMSSEITNNCLVIRTEGYINLQAAEAINAEAYTHLDKGIVKIVLSLAGTKIINSTGVSVLLELIERVQSLGGTLYFSNLSPLIEKTFTFMGLFSYSEKVADVSDVTG
jgi:anti-anti-sigma factor